jgi:hypothetical protein
MSIRDSQRMSEVSARRGSHADADSGPVAAGIVGTFRRDMRAVAENPAGSLHLFVGYRRVQRASPAERAVVDRKAGTWPPACRAHRPAPVRRAPDPVRGQVDRAARAHCSSVRPPVAGMRPGPRAPHPATAPTPVPALLDRADQLGDPFFPFDFNHNPANKMQIAYSGPWIPDFPVPYN